MFPGSARDSLTSSFADSLSRLLASGDGLLFFLGPLGKSTRVNHQAGEAPCLQAAADQLGVFALLGIGAINHDGLFKGVLFRKLVDLVIQVSFPGGHGQGASDMSRLVVPGAPCINKKRFCFVLLERIDEWYQ